MTVRLAGGLLAVADKTLGDVLHDLHFDLLSEVELSEDLLFSPYWGGSLLIVKLMLDCARLEPLNPHIVKPDNLN